MYHSYKAHITGKAQPSCSLIPTSKPCQRELLHGIDKFPSWYWSSAVQLEMFLNLPCRLRPANSSSKQMQMNATTGWQDFLPCFQNVSMNSKHVSSVHSSSPGQWSLSVRFKLSGQWSGKERRRLNSKVWSLGNSCCGMVTSCSFFVPFPMNCQSPAPSASESLCRYNILMCGFRYNLHETIMLFRRRNRSVLFPRSS